MIIKNVLLAECTETDSQAIYIDGSLEKVSHNNSSSYFFATELVAACFGNNVRMNLTYVDLVAGGDGAGKFPESVKELEAYLIEELQDDEEL